MFFLPSRGRPQSVKRLADAYRLTEANAAVMLLLDSDDSDSYLPIDLPSTWAVHVSSPKASQERIAEVYDLVRGADWYGLLGDDALPLTPHWDEILIEAAGDWYIAYSRDGMHDEKWPTHPVLGGKLVAALGWLILPGLKYLYADTVIKEIGDRTGALVYCPEVMIEHLHFSNDKSSYDETYKRHSDSYEHDKALFENWKQNQLTDDLEKIIQGGFEI